MPVLQQTLIAVHLVVILAMIGFILIQRSEGGGLGIGGGSGFMSSRGSANFLTKMTTWLAVGFFTTSLLMAILSAQTRKENNAALGQTTGSEQLLPDADSLLNQLDALDSGDIPSAPSGDSVPATSTESGSSLPQSPSN